MELYSNKLLNILKMSLVLFVFGILAEIFVKLYEKGKIQLNWLDLNIYPIILLIL